MQWGTEWCGDGNDGRESVQCKYDIPNYLQKVRSRVLSWCRNVCQTTRKKRGKSQQRKRECCKDGEVDNVPDMRTNRVFAHGLNGEDREINGEQQMEQVCGCGRCGRK